MSIALYDCTRASRIDYVHIVCSHGGYERVLLTMDGEIKKTSWVSVWCMYTCRYIQSAHLPLVLGLWYHENDSLSSIKESLHCGKPILIFTVYTFRPCMSTKPVSILESNNWVRTFISSHASSYRTSYLRCHHRTICRH